MILDSAMVLDGTTNGVLKGQIIADPATLNSYVCTFPDITMDATLSAINELIRSINTSRPFYGITIEEPFSKYKFFLTSDEIEIYRRGGRRDEVRGNGMTAYLAVFDKVLCSAKEMAEAMRSVDMTTPVSEKMINEFDELLEDI